MGNLIKIQNELKVPKGNLNKFGNYKYRSAEDILEAVKPIILKYEYGLIISDEIVAIGGKVFLKATAKLAMHEKALNGDEINHYCIKVDGYAELSEHKGMSAEQATGTASSYARKYALNGLFLIDETESDADSQKPTDKLPELTADKFEAMVKAINEGKKEDVIKAMKNYTIKPEYLNALNLSLKNN